jgi:radical SAM protein with 4Fe4S-binding SPASM domain
MDFINNFHEGDNPLIVTIETINRCNNKCSFCPASIGNETRPLYKMQKDLFEKIIAELKVINYNGILELFVNNEPFLDERIIDFHEFARTELPDSCILLFTNGLLFTLDKFLKIAPFVNQIIINNYNSTLVLHDNVKKIWEYSQKNKEHFPHLEIVIQKRFIDEKLSNRNNSAPNKKATREIKEPCLAPFTDLTIYPNGIVGLCCSDALEKTNMGNCNESTISEIWRSDKYLKIRQIMRKSRIGNDMCKFCDFVDTGLRLRLAGNK